jgi:hypothetical protein
MPNHLPWGLTAAVRLRAPQKLIDGILTAVTDLVGDISDNLDACVKGWTNLGDLDVDANTVSIAAVGSDGYDRVYTLAVNEAVRFAGYLKIYRAAPDGTGQVSLLPPLDAEPKRPH